MKIFLRELFYVLWLWVAAAFLLEWLIPGLVTAYFNLPWWLLFCVVLGIVIVIIHKENPGD